MSAINLCPRFELLGRLVLLVFVTLLVSACGLLGEDNVKDYREAETLPPLTVPDDLQMPRQSTAMHVPEVSDDGAVEENLEIPPAIATLTKELEVREQQEDEEQPTQITVAIETEIIRDVDDNELLSAKADLDTVWPALETALKSSGFTVLDKNRGRGFYTISREISLLDAPRDPSKPLEVELEKPKESYLVFVEEAGDSINISIRDENSKIDGSSLAKHLLFQLGGLLKNPE